jgi:hypothetical protein
LAVAGPGHNPAAEGTGCMVVCYPCCSDRGFTDERVVSETEA